MNLNSIPVFSDNYIWILSDNYGYCLIVDPGEAAPVISVIENKKWHPIAILLTHHHHDHTGGVKDLINKWPKIVSYGPKETKEKGATHIVNEGDIVSILGYEFRVIFTPGHTLGHISYYSKPYLFCGDTIFSGGCGRLLEGTAKQMCKSLQKISELPDETLICCAHEYTLSNLKFASAILPRDIEIQHYLQKVSNLRAKNRSSLPIKLEYEKKINLFLRIQDTSLQETLCSKTVQQSQLEIFSKLREKRDNFNF